MKKNPSSIIAVLLLFLLPGKYLYAQQQACKVLADSLAGDYTGDCKKGLADGKGDAKGIAHYTGTFKEGLPNGTGTYYYPDSSYYIGNFLAGVKEGKGEMHYRSANRLDSVIKGYWSGNEYRGGKYITYSFDAASKFDRFDILPSSGKGNRLSIEISTTTGTPAGLSGITATSSPRLLYVTELYCPDDAANLKTLAKHESPGTSYAEFEIAKFPVTLKGLLSNGQDFELQLYRCADWRAVFYTNWR